MATRVRSTLPIVVALDSFFNVVRNPCVEAAVTAADDIDEPRRSTRISAARFGHSTYFVATAGERNESNGGPLGLSTHPRQSVKSKFGGLGSDDFEARGTGFEMRQMRQV